jgi:hypothetical protein
MKDWPISCGNYGSEYDSNKKCMLTYKPRMGSNRNLKVSCLKAESQVTLSTVSFLNFPHLLSSGNYFKVPETVFYLHQNPQI